MKKLAVLFLSLLFFNTYSQTHQIIYPQAQSLKKPSDSTYSQIIYLGTDYDSHDYEYLFNHWYQPDYDIHLTTREGRRLLFTDINADNVIDMVGNSETQDTSKVGYAEYDPNAVPIFQFVTNFSMANYWPENLADLNNDGTDEILTGSEFPSLNVFNNDISFFRTLPVRVYNGFKQTLVSDLDGNNNIDFVTTQYLNGDFSINFYEYNYLNDTLNLTTRIDSIIKRYITNGDTLDTLVKIHDDSYSRFVKGDLDGDGFTEVAAGHVDGNACIFENNATGYKQVYFDNMQTYNMYQIAITNDINLNGKSELIVMGNYDGGPLFWIEADSNNSYKVIRKDFIDYGPNISILMLQMYSTDVDLDGKDDLVFINGSLVWVLKWNASDNKWDMLFYLDINHDYDTMWGNHYDRSFPGLAVNMEFYDIDNDGDKDMFISTDEDVTLFFESNLSVLGVENPPDILPVEYNLSQNYPNPFNPITTIKYSVPKTTHIALIVYDALGREIRKLVNEEKSAGNYTVQLNGPNLSSGVYFYVMKADNFIETKKLVLLK
jgi:hypothetical protein